MNTYTKPRNDGSIAFGFIILGIGIVLLLRKFGIFIPGWVLSWPMIFIAIGTFSLIKHEFKSIFGFFMLGFGVIFLLNREFDLDLGIGQFIWPVVLIVLGIYLITQKKKENKVMKDVWKNWEENKKTSFSSSGTSTVEDAKIV